MDSENDLRKWMADEFGECIFWIEPSPGGTVGFPDCLVSVGGIGGLIPIELKYDGMGEGEFGNLWKVKLRPAQARTLRRFGDVEVPSFVAVGTPEGKVWLTTGEEAGRALLAGEMGYCVEVRSAGDIATAANMWVEGFELWAIAVKLSLVHVPEKIPF